MRIANRLVHLSIVSVDRDQGPGVQHQRVHWAAFLSGGHGQPSFSAVSASSSSVKAPCSASHSSRYSPRAWGRFRGAASSTAAASSSARSLASAASANQSSGDLPARSAAARTSSQSSGARATLILVFTLRSYGRTALSQRDYPSA